MKCTNTCFLPKLRPLKCQERQNELRLFFVQSSTDECKYIQMNMLEGLVRLYVITVY